MSKKSLVNATRPRTIFSIDASTNSLAFGVFVDGELTNYGKIKFFGSDAYHKAGDATKKTFTFMKDHKADAVVIEASIYANSPKTAMFLSLVQGAILGAAQMAGVKTVVSVSPIQWQNWIGNPRLSPEEKRAIRNSHPDRSQSWYKSQERLFRKRRTMSIVNENFNTKIDDDDVADAVGVGWFAVENWNRLVNS